MGSQDILKFYGSKIDLSVDYSELYDFTLTNDDDFNTNSSNLDQFLIINNMSTNIYLLESGTPYIKKRTEEGWTADFVFNRESLPWVSGSTFYYWGISGETDPSNYADNNLSFAFTEDAKIIWKTIKYSPIETLSGYTNHYTTVTGSTPTLCEDGTSEDFNITIVFKRYTKLENCEIDNMGGKNDLVSGLTSTTKFGVRLTGGSESYIAIETLNKKWYDERNSRLGSLKIYLNGNPIYKIENFEEVVPTLRQIKTVNFTADGTQTTFDVGDDIGTLHMVNVRSTLQSDDKYSFTVGDSFVEFNDLYVPKSGSTVSITYYKTTINPLIQSWGEGTEGVGDLHLGETQFNLKDIKYFEEPLSFIDVRNRYKNEILPNYYVVECNYPCGENATPTPTPSVTPTLTSTPTNTPTNTPTPSVTATNTPTPSVTLTNTPTPTNTPTSSSPEIPTSTPTPSITTTNTPTQTPTLTQTETPTQTPTSTPTMTPSETATMTPTPTETPTQTPTMTPSETATMTPTPSQTPNETPTNTPSETSTMTPTPTQTPTQTLTSTPTETPTQTPTETPTMTPSETATMTPTPTETPTQTPTNTPSETATMTPTPTETPTMTPSETATMTPTPTETPTNTPSETATMTPTPTETPTMTPTETPTQTPTETPTQTPTETPTQTPTMTPSETATMTPTPTQTETPTQTPTQSETPTQTPTMTPSETPTQTPTMTMTPTPTSPPITLGNWYLIGDEGLYSGNTVPNVLSGGDMFFTYGNNTVPSEFSVTYNPNIIDFYSCIRFNTKNSSNVDYATLFQSFAVNGGTMSLTQNGNTAKYSFNPGLNLVNDFGTFIQVTFSSFLGAGGITQTQQSPVSFVKNVPITITIRG